MNPKPAVVHVFSLANQLSNHNTSTVTYILHYYAMHVTFD